MESTSQTSLLKLCENCENACYNCISDMLAAQDQKNFNCSFCHLKLTMEELFKLHWVDHKFGHICEKHTSFTSKDECDIHAKSFKFYCMDCMKCICEECSFDDELHTDHAFKRVDSIYNSCLKDVHKGFSLHESYLEEMRGVVKGIRENKNDILQAKMSVTLDFNEIIDPVKNSITNQVNEKIECLNNRDDTLSRRIEKLLSEKDKLKEQVETSTKSGLIAKKMEIMKRTDLLMEKPVQDFVCEPLPAKIRCAFIPEPLYGFLQVQKYSEAISKENFNESDQITDSLGTIWSLNVSIVEDSAFEKTLQASIKLADGITGEYLYEMILMHETDNRSLILSGHFNFESNQAGPEETLLTLGELERRGFVVNDVLNLKFTIRAPNVLKLAEYQQERLENMAAKRKHFENQLKE